MTVNVRNDKIVVEKDGIILEFTTAEAERIGKSADMLYYREDIVNYFENTNEYSKSVLKDENLINNILEVYTEYRYDADGGEEEDSMHWSECLRLALESFEDELKLYESE